MRTPTQYTNHIDPEYRRWGRKYTRFPGVPECARLIQTGEATGAWADIIVGELAENAASNIDDFERLLRDGSRGDTALFVLMALEEARLPESVGLLSSVLDNGDSQCRDYALRALRAIDTKESRRAAIAHEIAGQGLEPGA